MMLELGLLFAITAASACTPVEKDTLTGADLAAADPLFASLTASRSIGYAPAPGRRRVLSIAELKAISEAEGLNVAPTQEVCFHWPTAPLEPQAVEAAMKSVFPDAGIEIAELSRFPAPAGDLVFPRAGLQNTRADIALWRGHVTYGTGRKFDVWARVKVKVSQTRLIATETLRAGEIIREDQLRVETYRGAPLEDGLAATPAAVAGRLSRRAITAGTSIRSADLELPAEILRGDVVNVQVRSGLARISLEAQAATSARLGQMVQLKNTSSGKVFTARVIGAGRATLILEGAN